MEAFCTEALLPLGQKPAAHHRLLIGELERVARGESRRLMVFMPPGSAKSTYASKLFPAWFLAQRSGLQVIGASHTATLAETFSRDVQRYVRENSAALGYGLTKESVEIWTTSNGGAYRAAGVRGPITGSRADLAIIDDPIRGREDADSETIREKTWAWFLADLRTRLKPNAAIVLIQTRWSEDDLGGRLLATQADDWRVLSLPATATAKDALGRAEGDLLWQDDEYGYGAELRRVKAEYELSGAMRDWWSLFEQSPRPLEGGMFRVAQLQAADAAPVATQTVRAWDLAATAQAGTRDPDWTVGLRLAKTSANAFTIEDVVRFRGGPDEVERAIVATAQRDGVGVRISFPQDPGQAGKSQALYFSRALSGYRFDASPESGDKATRAAAVASQVNAGNVMMIRAGWNKPFVDELAGFPSGSHDDQVDALSRAFNALLAAPFSPTEMRFNLHAR